MIAVESSLTTFGFTFGPSETTTAWPDRKALSWDRLVEIMTSHLPGPKTGPCIVPATFSGTSRKKDEATQIDVAFLDSDTGVPLDEIVRAVKKMGWTAVVSSTHSHLTRRSEAKQSNWDKFFKSNPGSEPEDFLREEKGYRPVIARGATTAETIDGIVQIDHWPCPKFRVVIPLAKPWRAADYPSQAAANAAWKAAIEALAGALGLPHDQSCTDTSRLFYLPRRPPNGAVPETEVVDGEACDIFSLAAPAVPDLLNGHATKVNGTTHHAAPSYFEYADPITGEYIDLSGWVKSHGRTFLPAKLLQKRRPQTLIGHAVDNKVHIQCPNDGAHTHPQADKATFTSNAGNSTTKGFVFKCMHAHCVTEDRLFFVRKMLEERWIGIDDLTAAEYHLEIDPEAPDDIADPNYWQSVVGEADHAAAPDPADDDQRRADPFLASAITEDEITNIPPREKVYGHFLFRKFISAIGAPGGAGKTAYAFTVALAIATGKDLLNEGVHDPGAVWIYNLEDPRVELLRRVKAALIGHDLKWRDIAGNLYLDSGRDRPLVIAKATRDGGLIAWPQVPDLIAEIKAKGIRLLIVDPFVRSHRVEENYNDQIDFVAALWASIADAADCSILLVHHFKKGGVSGDAGAFRGATALIDASRAAVTLATMSAEEAEKMSVAEKDRWQYIRTDNAKLNLAPPPDGATWLKLWGADLHNGTTDRDSDNVQTVKRWKFKKESALATLQPFELNAVLDLIQEGPEEGVFFTASKRGGSARWAGYILTQRHNLTDNQAADIIAAWIKTGLLIEANYMHPKWRRLVIGVQVDNSKRPT